MPFDGLTISFLRNELAAKLIGARVDKCLQPERDEIILNTRNNNENISLLISASAGCARTHITSIRKNNPLEPPNMCMLLRKHLTGARIVDIRQIDCDRILVIEFEHFDEMGERARKLLVCEFMGKHSNIIFTQSDGRIIESARHVTEQISSVRQVLPGLMYKNPPAHGKLSFDSLSESALEARLATASPVLHKAIGEAVCGLSQQTAREIAFRATGDEDSPNRPGLACAIISAVCDILSSPMPTLIMGPDGVPFDATAFAFKSRAHFRTEYPSSLSEAFDMFYRARDNAERIKQKSSSLNHVIKNNLERDQKKLQIQLEALINCEKSDDYRIKGELINAGLYLIGRGAKSVKLTNYYDEAQGLIEIELDERLSPAQNAQRYFKLYQKARNSKKHALEQKALLEKEINYLEEQLLNLENCDTEAELNEIREELERGNYVNANHNRRQIKRLPPSKPQEFAYKDGTRVFVGRNNRQNDELTFSAKPNYVWLHAKDMPGSHVIIACENPGDDVISYAASLAARFSKGRENTRVPIDYTLKKYVKKPSGAKPGFVTYSNQRTVFVRPYGLAE